MGWTAYYQILRDRPFDDAELQLLVDRIATHNRTPWEGESFGLAVARSPQADGVIATGWQKLPHDLDSLDLTRLCTVLTELAATFVDIELRAADDYGCLAWEPGARVVSCTSRRGPPLVGSISRDDFVDPASVVAPTRSPLPPAVDAWLAGGAPTVETLATALRELAACASSDPRADTLRAALTEAPTELVAQAALDAHAEVHRATATADLARSALREVAGAALTDAVVEGFLAVWREPHGLYWYGDMDFPDEFLDRLAETPAVVAAWVADVEAARTGGPDELGHRRAEQAAIHLARRPTAATLSVLIDAARGARSATATDDQTYHSVPGIYEGLARAGGPAVVATLLLDLGTRDRWARHHGRALATVAAWDPTRAHDVARALIAAEQRVGDVIPTLERLGDVAALEVLAGYPVDWVRRAAAAALGVLGAAPPAEPTSWSLGARLLHPAEAVRDEALRELDRSGDPSVLASLVIGDALDRAIRADSTGIAWRSLERLPAKVRRRPIAEQLATLTEQAALPELTEVLSRGIAESAAALRRPRPRLTEASERALLAEEDAILAALRGGRLAPTEPTAAIAAPAVVTWRDQDAASAPSEVAPSAASPTTAADDDALIDALLAGVVLEQVPSPAVLAAAGLSASLATDDRRSRGRALHERLLGFGATRVGRRLIACAGQLRDAYVAGFASEVLPQALTDPEVAAALVRAWDQAHGEPWPSPTRFDDMLRAGANHPHVLGAALEVLGAPGDTTQRDRTASALDVLASATEHRRLVAAALVARVAADRAWPDPQVPWRNDVYRALAKVADATTVATALLELAAPREAHRREALLEWIARAGRGSEVVAVVRAALDWPGLAAPAARLLRSGEMLGRDEREQLLAHPFWRVRLAVADGNPRYDDARVERYAVWAAIDAAGAAVPDNDRRWARSDQDPPGATWAELAARYGTPIVLPPLPPPAAGVDAACADYRAWALWSLDEQPIAAELALRIAADELDRAMTARGGPRTGARWSRWRAIGVDVPVTRAERLRWLRAQPRDGLSANLAAIARDGADGAAAVAASLPGPLLALSAEDRLAHAATEDEVVARGRVLLAEGPPPALIDVAPPARVDVAPSARGPRSSGVTYF